MMRRSASSVLIRSALFALALTAIPLSLPGQTSLPPALFSLNPSSASVGTPGLSLTVTGANFRLGDVVAWNGASLSTAFSVGSTQLTAIVPAVLLSVPGTATITVFSAGGLRSNSLPFSISGPPVAISTSAVSQATGGIPYSFSFTATGGTAPYLWSVSGPLPPGLTLSSGGVLSGTPSDAGTFTFTVQATDARNQTASQTFSILVTAPALSIVSTSPLPRGTAGQNYRFVFAASNGTAPYRWNAGQGLPSGLTFDATTGIISGIPTANGTFSFLVQVLDSRDAFATRIFTLTIDPAPLTITTVSPLFSATVGEAYAQTLTASGGVAPYRWAITSGDAAGLTLDPNAGVLQGSPRTAGTIFFTVQVTDNTGSSVFRSFSVVVNPPTLTIPTPSALPNGSVGVSYAQVFSVVGGATPYSWSVISGNVPGLNFNPAIATLAGIPTAAGTYSLSLLVRDVVGASTTRTFTIVINASALRITTDTQLPDATLVAAFAQEMTASGGTTPYIWSATGLPEGLAIDTATGVISGVPSAAGSYAFTVRVTDSARATVIELFRIIVNLPPVPGASISGLPAVANPAEQFALRVSLNDVFPAPISGQAVLSFAPDSGGGDNTIQFSSGGRTADFTIPADSRDAQSTIPLALQTGTVAGTITVSLRLRSGGVDITPIPAPTARVRIERQAPVVRSARVIRNANGFGIEITGSSTAREVTQASFTFAVPSGQSLQSSTIVVPVEDLFNKWYQDPSSSEFGSQFVFTQSFTVQGNATAVTPQSVTLTNRIGSVTAQIQQ